jgi:two-component system OmpR family response regulator
MHILIAEDDPALAEGLCYSLRQCGYAVDRVQNGLEADAALADMRFDLLILDLGLPAMDGFQILRRARARGSRLPILILTARDSVDDRVQGLDLGADDYLAKPFSLSELQARVRALMRRGEENLGPLMCLGRLRFDKVSRSAWVGEQHVDLSARELAVLEVLLRRPGHLVNKERLVDAVYEWGEEATDNAIEVYIHRLRKKLDGSGVKITTTRGLGYCLEGPQPVPDQDSAA